jgi:endonuclease/exonuclease/phosphatase family metal-dependent hydrolase
VSEGQPTSRIGAGIQQITTLIRRLTKRSERHLILGVIIFSVVSASVLVYRGRPLQMPETLPQEVKFMNYNVHFGVGMDDLFDLERIAQNILVNDPDILGLQEVELGRTTSGNVNMVHWFAHRLNMTYILMPASNGEAFGVALLSKYQWRNASAIILPSLSLERPLVMADFTMHDARTLRVMVTHVGFGDENSMLQINTMLAAAPQDDTPTVLMGDFNFNDTMPEIQAVKAAGFVDTWLEVGTRSSTWPAWPTPDPEQSIDFIFVRSLGATVQAAGVLNDFDPAGNFAAEYGSDHFPVHATILF